MKKIFPFIISLLSLNIYGQEEVKSIIERVNNAEYIFEGKVIFSKAYENRDENNIYTTSTIEITKILKGNLQCGKIEVITQGGEIGDRIKINSHYLTLKEGYAGIFLCGQNKRELPQIDYMIENNTVKLAPIFEKQSYIKYYYEGEDLIASDVTFNVDSLARLYDLVHLVSQLNYIDCNNSRQVIFKDESKVGDKVIPSPQVFPVYKKSDYDRTISQMEYLNSRARPKHSGRSTNDLTYTLANAIITGTGPRYFEFDIMLNQSDPSQYFNRGLARIQYSSAAFGSNIVTNNKIIVTRGTVIADATTYDAPTPLDISANEVAIPFSVLLTNVNLYPLGSSPTDVAHIKIEIANCNTNSTVGYTSQTIMELLSYYGTSSNDTFGQPYDAITATQSVPVPACRSTITSFSPATINGGVNELLTIKGFQFGTSGNVYFPNADDGGSSKVAVNQSDIIFGWNDTIITINIPGYNDTVVNNLNATIRQPYSKPGSGVFVVSSDQNGKDTSNSPLTIYYSVENYPIPVKRWANLIKKDANGGYEFKVDTALWNHPDRKACVIKAVEDWKCLTGVKWDVVGSIVTPSDTGILDGNNIIQLGTTDISPLGVVLANTSNNLENCSGKLIAREIDLVFNNTVDWWYDTTTSANVPTGKKDFYAAILHELGHAHSLNHIINPNAIMRWNAQPTGPLNANQRLIHLDTDGSCGFGGDKVMTLSTSVGTLSCSGSPLPIVRQFVCIPFTSIRENNEPKFEIGVFPNPFTDEITISYTIEKEAMMDMFVMDMQGRTVAQDEPTKVSIGEYKSTIPLKGLPSGQYIVWGHLNGKVFYKNIIKK